MDHVNTTFPRPRGAGAAVLRDHGTCPICGREGIVFAAPLTPGSPAGCARCLVERVRVVGLVLGTLRAWRADADRARATSRARAAKAVA